jgi:hypothetical protein
VGKPTKGYSTDIDEFLVYREMIMNSLRITTPEQLHKLAEWDQLARTVSRSQGETEVRICSGENLVVRICSGKKPGCLVALTSLWVYQLIGK